MILKFLKSLMFNDIAEEERNQMMNGNATGAGDVSENGDSLHPQLLSPTKISSRTVVTENDPLGALMDEQDEIIQVHQQQPQTQEQLEKMRIQSAMYSDTPILFKGHRSATFDEGCNLTKGMNRSETMPMASITSSFANIGSSLKFGFR